MTDRDIDLIEAYRNGTLAGDDVSSFEQRLNEDPQFKQLVVEHMWTLDGFEGMQMQALEESLRRRDVRPGEAKGRQWLYALVALAVAVVIFFLVRGLTSPKTSSNSILAEAFYLPPISLVERSESRSMSEGLREAFVLYGNKEWRGAAEQFAAIGDRGFNATARYYEAHCRYQLGQFAEAQVIFTSLTSNGQYDEQSEWFAALCLLQIGQTNEAIGRLEAIVANDNHFYREKASELLSGIGIN